ncbi:MULTISPECIES: GNAT family N-acetyltransferase [Actinomadura]|uniref:GNAT family N-acetyltransferase n=1 Tax=Actinomadura litoris TaxID=2678616 RepID=A0A7K1L091_9ACTN|nr:MULTISPECIES: GNAT family protein [Actinomadura]MBT2211696.1 GNAT family N-acetyltransferase [Actinomadura sp. NEAU-AAG7]MUN37809.1 GNAT family N-acetyltransferase [Actinomadura litoris]
MSEPLRAGSAVLGPGSAAPRARNAVLRTGRLVLHPVAMSDHRALHTHWTGPLVRRHLFGDQVISPVQVTGIIAASQRDFAVEGYGLWALRPSAPGLSGPHGLGDPHRLSEPHGARLVGVAGLRRHDGPAGGAVDVEILYSLEPDRWGQGLAVEASRAVLGYAFEVVGLRRITAEIDVSSASSAAVAEQLGMRPWHEGSDGPDGASYVAAERTHWLRSRRGIDAVP